MMHRLAWVALCAGTFLSACGSDGPSGDVPIVPYGSNGTMDGAVPDGGSDGGADTGTTGFDGSFTGFDANLSNGDGGGNDGDAGCVDEDDDSVCDDVDLCLGSDDALDADGDTVPDGCDKCSEGDGDDLADLDGDGVPDACDADADGDGVDDDGDNGDNCPGVANPDQSDIDGDLEGDACDDDDDGDGVDDATDNCPRVFNAPAMAGGPQDDEDGDGNGDACDLCPGTNDYTAPDDDGDLVPNACDNCLDTANGPEEADVVGVGNQSDIDDDDAGDACDSDADGDGVDNEVDNCPLAANGAAEDNQADTDGDGNGDACDLCEGFIDGIDFDDDGLLDRCDDACGPGTELALGAAHWWRLGEAAEATAPVDSSAYPDVAELGVYGAAVELKQLGPTEDFDGAARFPGGAAAGSHVRVVAPPRMPSDALSLSMWVQFESLDTPQTLLSYAVGSDADVLQVALVDDGGTQLRVSVDGNTFDAPFAAAERTWLHLAITWDSGTGAIAVYENGGALAEGNVAQGATLQAGGRLVLGQAQGSGQGTAVAADAPFVGMLDEVALFDAALAPAAVAAIAEAFGPTHDCAELPRSCKELLEADLATDDGEYRVYPGTTGFDVQCDMTTDGGGWTLCGNVDGTDCVAEGDLRNADDLDDGSFCVALFGATESEELMVTISSGERVQIDWSSTPIVPYDYGADTAVTCRYFNAAGTEQAGAFPDCHYASHKNTSGGILDGFVEGEFQDAAWSFVADGVDNGYEGNLESRVLLGPTYETCPGNDEAWINFAGQGSVDVPVDAGDLYLR